MDVVATQNPRKMFTTEHGANSDGSRSLRGAKCKHHTSSCCSCSHVPVQDCWAIGPKVEV
jgi:hypothetical protein